MKDQDKIKQKYKNIIFHLVSVLLIGISVLLYQLSESYYGMNTSAAKLVTAMDNPEEIRAKYSDTQKYLEAIEKLLANTLEHQITEWKDARKIYSGLYKLLLFVAIFQIGILLWPVKKSDEE